MTDPQNRPREQGVALMMTLGVLSLILILAMSFSFTARTGRMLSENNADMIRAGLQAKSALDRVVADIGFTFSPAYYASNDRLVLPGTSSTVSSPTPFAYTPTGTSPYKTRPYWVSRQQTGESTSGLDEALSLSLGFPTSRAFLPTLSAGEITSLGAGWEYIRDFENKVVARRAFVILDESYKIDPRAVLTPNGEPYWASPPANGFYDLDGDTSYDSTPMADSSPLRLGLSPQEIRILNNTIGTPTFANLATAFEGGLPIAGGSVYTDWFSWRHIAASLPMTSMPATEVDYMTRCFTPYSYDIEAYRYDPGSGEKDYHRFDLWGVDWEDGTKWDDTAELDALGAAPSLFWTGTPGGSISPTASTAAPALAFFTDATTTSRVLLNLVDFCDTDSEASRFPTGDEWDLTAVGNEAHPYINEVAIEALYAVDPGADGVIGTGADDTGTFRMSLYLELAEIYGISKDFEANARITFQLEHCDASGNPTGTTNGPFTEVIPFSNGTATASGYTVVKTAAAHAFNPYSYAAPTPPLQLRLSITKLEVHVKADDGTGTNVFADYAHLVNAAGLQVTLDGQPAVPDAQYASIQTDDPRCNTTPDRWVMQPSGNPGFFATTSGHLTLDVGALTGAKNTDVNPSTGSSAITSYAAGQFDPETVTDPVAGISTAYIANKATISFWELGAIHRGEPWRTVNLTDFKKHDGTFRTYVDGDAVLLSQLKLGGFVQTRGKVNANCPDEKVWRQVLHGLRLGTTYADPDDTAVSAVDSEALAQAVVDDIMGATPIRFLERGQFVETASFSDGTAGAQATDRAKEELIGKLANLLTVRQNLFTVLVTAQTLKDTGANNANRYNTIQYDGTNYCNILAEQRLLATVYRDALTNVFRVARIEYLED